MSLKERASSKREYGNDGNELGFSTAKMQTHTYKSTNETKPTQARADTYTCKKIHEHRDYNMYYLAREMRIDSVQ